MTDPIPFDSFVTLGVHLPGDDAERNLDVVYHRDILGVVVAWHSPLDNGAIRCAICENGARVYLDAGEER
jgi:hypothetical protein